MLLFKPEHVEPIRRGVKTQTRRRGNRRWNVGACHQCRTRLFGEQPFAVVRVTAVRRQRLRAITAADVRAEGYATLADYRAVWESIYGPWRPNEMVWVVDFELVR